MMGRQSGQLSMMVMDLSELIPNNHLLRRISQVISFDFIYEILEPYYPSNGRPSIDPISMFKMLLVGYLYGIKSERRLVQEIQLNIAYRWFCGFELADKIPDHSTLSKTRLRKWNESQLFQQVFLEIVRRCVKSGLVDGKELAADGTYLPANVSRDSWIETEVEAELSMQSYLDRLDEELSKQPGFKKPPIKTIKKRRTTSKTDPDSGCINHGKKSGIGYLMETTVDCKCGIITGVDVYPANEKESLLVLRHLERQIQNGVPMQNIALDRGYDTGAVHRGLELLGITGYIPAIQFSNSPEKYGFVYLPQEDAFCCPEGARLVYQRLNCSQTTGKYLRCYQVQGETCKHCKRKSVCFKQTGIRRRILGSSCYPAFYRGHERIGSDAYWHMMRLRKIWAEGSFSVLKREHCLSKIRKRGILAVTEECLLSAMALNLKRMVKAILLFLYKPRMWVENIVFCPIFHFCQQVRKGAQNLRVDSPEKKRRLELDKGIVSFEDEVVAESMIKDASESEIYKMFCDYITPPTDGISWLAKQRLSKNGKLTVAGEILFSDEPQICLPKRSSIKVYRYKTSGDSDRATLDGLPFTIEGCAYNQIYGAVAKVKEIIESIKKLGKQFEAIEYPEETLHEIITNAVLHRDYSIATDIQIRIYDNRVEVESPGKLPGYVTVENILDAQSARNPKIVRVTPHKEKI